MLLTSLLSLLPAAVTLVLSPDRASASPTLGPPEDFHPFAGRWGNNRTEVGYVVFCSNEDFYSRSTSLVGPTINDTVTLRVWSSPSVAKEHINCGTLSPMGHLHLCALGVNGTIPMATDTDQLVTADILKESDLRCGPYVQTYFPPTFKTW